MCVLLFPTFFGLLLPRSGKNDVTDLFENSSRDFLIQLFWEFGCFLDSLFLWSVGQEVRFAWCTKRCFFPPDALPPPIFGRNIHKTVGVSFGGNKLWARNCVWLKTKSFSFLQIYAKFFFKKNLTLTKIWLIILHSFTKFVKIVFAPFLFGCSVH